MGTVDQLNIFLRENPKIPRESILVDDYNHRSYKNTMGFKRFDRIEDWTVVLREMNWTKLIVPLFGVLGIPSLVTYLGSINRLAPVPEGEQLDWKNLPEGGLRNGGTIVLGSKNDRVLYRWNDAIPGDVPAPSDVYDSALSKLES